MSLSTEKMLVVLEEALAGAPPAKHTPEMSALEALKATKGRTQESARRVTALCEAMPCILAFLDAAEGLEEAELNDESGVEGKKWRQVIGSFEETMQRCLGHENLSVRRAVALPMLQHFLNLPAGQKEAESVLVRLKNKTLLDQSDQGAYKLSDQLGLSADDKKGLAPLLSRMTSKVVRAIRTVEVPVAKSVQPAPDDAEPPIVTDRDITPGEAWRRECRGQFKLNIPPNGDGKGGGTLHMEAQDHGMLFVGEATNGLYDLMNGCIPISALKDENGNIRDNLKLVPPAFPSDEAERKWMEKMDRLGYKLQCGFRVALEGKKDMPPEEFLVNDGPVGDSLIVFEDFQWDPPNDPDGGYDFDELALRFCRRDDGQIALIEILTEEAEDLFGPLVGKFYVPGYAFVDVPQPLRNFLKASYGRFVPKRSRLS